MSGGNDPLRIAFWGTAGSFDYCRVGGTDAIARRLGREMVQRGAEVAFLHFGGRERLEQTAGGIVLRHCATFAGGLAALEAGAYDHVVTVYIPPRLRVAYARFRRRHARRMRFHLLQVGWSESRLRRRLALLDAQLAPYNGCTFCLSPRLQRAAARCCRRAALLLPPVPGDYYLSPGEKPGQASLRVAYVGRVDPGKGTGAALALFRRRARAGGYETCIYGYPWRHSPESVRLHEALLAQDMFLASSSASYVDPVDNNFSIMTGACRECPPDPDPNTTRSSGCQCSTGPRSSPTPWLVLLMLLAVAVFRLRG